MVAPPFQASRRRARRVALQLVEGPELSLDSVSRFAGQPVERSCRKYADSDNSPTRTRPPSQLSLGL